ncbi:hypothetical protein Sste5346_002663 [Sporothrix stenoceras]|uniref:Putative transcription factor kapC n=1 Tax=Sporothrix stenoceras TaxID=5173 RepID=A0ABR3ZHJ9_9PEZI
MDATHSSHLYDAMQTNGLSPRDLSPHDTTGFAFNSFEGEPFADADNSFVEPLSTSGSPFQYAMTYDMDQYTAEGGLPSPQTGGPSPASTAGSMLDNVPMGMMTMPEQQMQQPMVSSHIRSHPGSVSSVASSATAVSTISNGLMPELNADGTIVKKELSPGPMMGNVTPPKDVATLATDAAAPAEATAAPANKPAKRKRENRYKNAPPAVLSRRRAQNRASQRAYRERKDQRIRDLESELEKVRHENEANKLQLSTMHHQMLTLRMEQSMNSPSQQQQRSVSMSGMPPQVQMHQQFLPDGLRVPQMPMTMMNQGGMVPMQQSFPMAPHNFPMAP